MHLYESFARALSEHGLTTMYGLMGDGNLFMVDEYIRLDGCHYVPAAHEASAVLMAHGHASVTDGLGVATITHGPALTNTITALVEASLGRVPLLVIAGDTAATDMSNVQNIAQREFVLPTGAGFEQVRSPATALRDLATAIRRAHLERRPVVLNVPIDFWWQDVDHEFVAAGVVALQAAHPDPDVLDRALGIVASARRPLVLAGRGASAPEATAAVRAFAERIGAPVSTTAKAKDLFRGDPFDLGIFGGLANEACRSATEESDCIIVFGAGLNNRTTAEQGLLRGKSVIQVDLRVEHLGHTARVDVAILGDAGAVARSMTELLDEAEVPASRFASPELAARVAAAADVTYEDRGTDETVDLRTALRAVDAALPRERTLVFDAGRFAFSAFALLHAPHPRSFVDLINFGSIGLGMAGAIGAAVADRSRPVLLACGDGGFMMGGLTEFATAVRQRADLVVAVFNDGSYGAEHVQFTARDMDPSSSLHDWPDLAPVAEALGGEGYTVRDDDDLARLPKVVAGRSRPLLLDIKLDPARVTVPGH